MKKLILMSMVAVMFSACNQQKNDQSKSQVAADSVAQTSAVSIAVVNSDSILMNYQFAKSAQEKLAKKAEDAKLSLNLKQKSLEKEMAEFQKKYENQAFISQASMESQAKSLQKKQYDLQAHGEQLEGDFMNEQSKLGQQLKDSIDFAIKELNKGRFSLVLSTSSMNDNVLFVDDKMNITNEILEFLNKRYK
ncbi:MAG: OmpH family outer membrane protein [Prevotellaceae bacterium]|jgi:outer membrane protein|nr:OmpH family outer membrane protein [Prevotellaceae bacterium]